jgi:hypothetical protein
MNTEAQSHIYEAVGVVGTPVGLLINFNSPILKDGIVRRVL